MKKIAVIILAYNGENFLPDCLVNLEKVNYPRESIKILLVDNASTDGSAELIKKYAEKNMDWCEYIENKENLGFAAGNNVGIKRAMENGCDYIYFLNQDTEVSPDFLIEAANVMDGEEKIVAVQSQLLLWQDKDKINSGGNEIHYLGFGYAKGNKESIATYYPEASIQSETGQPLAYYQIAYASGAASLWRVSALKEIGLFNEEFFMYHEDLDLGWRARLMGYEIVLAFGSVVYHKYEFSRSIKKFYFMERNRYLTVMQNYRLATMLVIFPVAFLMGIGMFFYSFFAGWWREELRVIEYFLQNENWNKLLETRKTVQAKRRVGDKDVVKFFTGKILSQEIDNPILTKIVNPIMDVYWQLAKMVIRW